MLAANDTAPTTNFGLRRDERLAAAASASARETAHTSILGSSLLDSAPTPPVRQVSARHGALSLTSVISIGEEDGDGVRRHSDSYQWRAPRIALRLSE